MGRSVARVSLRPPWSRGRVAVYHAASEKARGTLYTPWRNASLKYVTDEWTDTCLYFDRVGWREMASKMAGKLRSRKSPSASEGLKYSLGA